MPVEIPPSVAAGLRAIIGLDDETFGTFVNYLNEPNQELSPASVIKRITKSLNVPNTTARQIWHALYFMHSSERVPRRQVIRDVVEALSAQGIPSPTLSKRITALVEITSVATLMKSLELLVRNVNNYASSRTVADMRPVFMEEGDDPAAFVVVHELEIRYEDTRNESENLRNFYVAMDEADLEDLIATLQRSLKKAESLKSHLRANRQSFLATNREAR